MKADLHVHTCFSSDGKTTPEQLVEAAVKHGIGCIAVSDHNEFKAYEILKDNKDVIIIPAEEVSSAEGHIIGLGIDRLIPPGRSIQETIDLIHEAGGYAVAVHPYRKWSGLGEENTLKYDFDAIEARNGRSVPSHNRKSEKLARRIGKPITVGSDAHSPTRIGFGYLEIPDDITTWQEAVEYIMSGQVKNTYSHSRHIAATIWYGLRTFFKWVFRGCRRI